MEGMGFTGSLRHSHTVAQQRAISQVAYITAPESVSRFMHKAVKHIKCHSIRAAAFLHSVSITW